MLRNTFYHKSIRKTLISFASLFNDISIDSYDSVGNLKKTINVPLEYISKEKFINKFNYKQDKELEIKTTLPAMGFEMGTIAYDSERKTNSIDKLVSKDGQKFMFNRVPFTIPFNLYIGTRLIDDSLKIVEQILPYFDPSFTVEIKDNEDFEMNTKIPFTLQSIDSNIDTDGSMETRRDILWTLGFTSKIYLYKAIRDPVLIKKAIIDINDPIIEGIYNEYLFAVDPISAYKNEPHTTIETINTIKTTSYYGEEVSCLIY